MALAQVLITFSMAGPRNRTDDSTAELKTLSPVQIDYQQTNMILIVS